MYQFLRMRNLCRVGHHRNHALPLAIHANHQMPQHALSRFFLIGSHTVPLRPSQKGVGDPIRRLHGVGAFFYGNHGMASGSIEAQHRSAIPFSQGKRGFIAVVKGILHSDHGRDSHFQSADPRKAVLHLLPLGIQGRFIAHMPSRTSAASRPGITVRFPPFRRSLRGHLLHTPEGIPFFRPDDANLRLLSGQQPGHKNRLSFRAADTLQIRSQSFSPHPDALVFFHLRVSSSLQASPSQQPPVFRPPGGGQYPFCGFTARHSGRPAQ